MTFPPYVPQLVIDLAHARENLDSNSETITVLTEDLRQSKESNRLLLEKLKEKDVINFNLKTQLQENEKELTSLRQRCEYLMEKLKTAENDPTHVTSVGDLQSFVNRGT